MTKSLRKILPLVVFSITTCQLAPVQAATSAPETLLGKESVVYLRYDGMDAHRKGYQQTVMSRLMREDLGDLVGYLVQLAQDAMGPELLSDRLLSGVTPRELLMLQKAAKGIPHLMDYFQRKGAVVGVEVIDPTEPRLQVSIVFPGAGKDEKSRSAIFGAVRLIGLVAQVEIKSSKKRGRTVLHFEEDKAKFACWREGDHMLVTIGTEDLDYTLSLMEGKRPSFIANPLHKKLTGFKDYETCARGLVDFQGILQIVAKVFPPATEIAKQLGLTDLNNLSFHFGFQGKYQRSTVMLETSGVRKGLLRILSSAKPISLDKLPAFPPDATSVHASQLDWTVTFDALLDAAKVVMKIYYPFSKGDEVEAALKGFEKSAGLDLRKDLFGSLGSGVAAFNSPSQGPLSLGFCLALEVKDAKKLLQSLEIAVKSAAAFTGSDIAIKTRKYRGVDLHMIHVAERGFFFTPSYAIDDGWLVTSFFPQPVQSWIMRSRNKDFPSWKPPPLLAKTLRDIAAARPGEKIKVTSISVVDRRPGVKQVLAIAPLIVSAIQNFSQSGQQFDISLIPNPSSVSDLIGHSVTVGIDDGKTMRFESIGTFPLPLEVSGLDIYTFFIFTIFARVF